MYRKFFPYGTVYKIERDYTHGDISRHLRAIRQNGLNTVVVWPAVYWWEERTSGYYPFATGRFILEEAERIDLHIVMEFAGQITSLEYAPDFIMKTEYLVEDESGHPTEFRGGYCPLNINHPAVKSLIEANFRQAAAAYKNYPALLAYDIWNETQFTSYDRYTLYEFRSWLARKYKTIQALNNAWDRIYYDWSQIRFTRWLWASVMPSVDYQEFKKDNIGSVLSEWREIVRNEDPDHTVIADNVGSMINSGVDHTRPQDDWNVAENVDIFGISLYPKYHGPGDVDRRLLSLDASRSAGGEHGFWISELQTHITRLFAPASCVKGKELELWNWEAIARGASGIIHWKWRPFVRGGQTLGRGLVDYDDNPTDRSRAVKRVASVLHRHNEIFTRIRPEKPRAWIIYDRLSQEFFRVFGSHEALYRESLAGIHRGCSEQSLPLAFIRPRDFIDRVSLIQRQSDTAVAAAGLPPLVFITCQVPMDPEFAESLLLYTASGGTLIVDGKFADVRPDGRRQDRIPGAGLAEALGYHVFDTDDAEAFIDFSVGSGEDAGFPRRIKGGFERRLVTIDSPECRILARFTDNQPALIESSYGRGRILSFQTFVWNEYTHTSRPGMYEFLRYLTGRAGPAGRQLALSDDPEVRILRFDIPESDQINIGRMIFAFNYGGGTKLVSQCIKSKLDKAGSPIAAKVRDLGSGEELKVITGTGSTQQDRVEIELDTYRLIHIEYIRK